MKGGSGNPNARPPAPNGGIWPALGNAIFNRGGGNVQRPQGGPPPGTTVGQMIPGFQGMNQDQRVQATQAYGQQHGMDMSQAGWARNGATPGQERDPAAVMGALGALQKQPMGRSVMRPVPMQPGTPAQGGNPQMDAVAAALAKRGRIG